MRTNFLRAKIITVIAFLVMTVFAGGSFAEEFLVKDASEFYDAIMEANRLQGENHVIAFSENLSRVKLPGEVPIRAGVEILGDGITIEGSGTTGLFKITEGSVIFDSVTFTGGNEQDFGGAVEIKGSNVSVEFRNCTFFNNRAGSSGGAVCVTEAATNGKEFPVVFKNCTIAKNYSGENGGGGIAVRNGIVSLNLSIVAGNFEGNSSGDIFCDSDGILTGFHNVAGKVQSNNLQSNVFDFENQDYAKIFVTDSNGNMNLEEISGAQVLRLSANSPALDILSEDAGYVLSYDEVGSVRPQLTGYDAGAFEAVPVEVLSVDIHALPYMQVNTSEKLNLNVYPENASINPEKYPDGIEWKISDSEIISVDNSGNISARREGSAYVSAIFHGWNEFGEKTTVSSKPVLIYTGLEPRGEITAQLEDIQDLTLLLNDAKILIPEVVLTVNDYAINGTIPGRDYALSVSALDGADLLTAEIISDDAILITTDDFEGTSVLQVTAKPLPSGISKSVSFDVDIYDSSYYRGKDNSGSSGKSGSHGGGCDSGIFGIAALILVAFSGKRVD